MGTDDVKNDATAPPGDDSRYVTLAEFAVEVDRDEDTVQDWKIRRPNFPRPVPGLRRKRPGQTHGPGAQVYVRAELWRWYDTDGPAGPPRLAVPAGASPDAMMTLGAIAAANGLDGRTITQYRAAIEQEITPEVAGQRKKYPIGKVVTVLNLLRRGWGAPQTFR